LCRRRRRRRQSINPKVDNAVSHTRFEFHPLIALSDIIVCRRQKRL